jgi:hypothetical protein
MNRHTLINKIRAVAFQSLVFQGGGGILCSIFRVPNNTYVSHVTRHLLHAVSAIRYVLIHN